MLTKLFPANNAVPNPVHDIPSVEDAIELRESLPTAKYFVPLKITPLPLIEKSVVPNPVHPRPLFVEYAIVLVP